MQFLAKYGLSPKDIELVIDKIDENDLNYYNSHQDIVIEILDYLNEKGIVKPYLLLFCRPQLFYNSITKIKLKLENSINLIPAINEDFVCFEDIEL